jgi:hypothetical protein
MIRDEHERTCGIRGADILDPEDVHQVVSREIDPERSDVPLAKSPEHFPRAGVHTPDQPDR